MNLFGKLLILFVSIVGFSIHANAQDGSSSTRELSTELIRQTPPRLSADTTMTAEQLAVWRGEMAEAMKRLMKHPDSQAAHPRKISEAARPGYKIERWQSYPFADARVNFYVLIPDGVSAENPARAAVLCLPGFGQTKELLAGEPLGVFDLSEGPDSVLRTNAMARIYAQNGLVAVALDNPSFGELSDNGFNDYLNTSRILLEEDWSYLGLTSWQHRVVLDWLKHQPFADSSRIIVSGFSLGTEPLMVLGLLDPDIYAFVYNDFLCRTRERILVMDRPDENGQRRFPNTIEHLVPGFLKEFDFPDIVAALAPRPLICTEGGLDRDFRLVQTIYKNAGAPDVFRFHHYDKYADPASRPMLDKDALPPNLDLQEFFNLVNVDSPNHSFKHHLVIPWLRTILPNP